MYCMLRVKNLFTFFLLYVCAYSYICVYVCVWVLYVFGHINDLGVTCYVNMTKYL